MRISVLGSTGSIGKQTLDVIDRHPERFSVETLAAHSSHEALFAQVAKYRPKAAALVCPPPGIPEELRFCEWFLGEGALEQLAAWEGAEAVMVAVVGAAGLTATLAAIEAGKRILLANKETLVAGGDFVMRAAREKNVPLLPVDSEHSAIFQCLQDGSPAEKILLCASGGPFLHTPKEEMDKARPAQALRHPNWSMGAKITVDSATMMNKGLEFIEAHYLFGMPPEKIEVVVQPQSVIHSMVEFADGGVMAQLAMPDMRMPILYAMGYPERLDSGMKRLDFAKLARLDFFAPDYAKFRCLQLAVDAAKAGNDAMVALNAANEIAVKAFLEEKILLGGIPEIVEKVLERPRNALHKVEDILAADAEARRFAEEILTKR